MTDKQRERYDKLNAAKDASDQAYLNMYLKAGNDQEANKLAWAKMKEEGDRWNMMFNYNKDKDAKEAEAKAQQFKDKLEADTENARLARESAERIARIRAEAKKKGESGDGSGTGKGRRVEPVTLSNGSAKGNKGAQFKIHPDVWAGCMPHIFNILKEEYSKKHLDDVDLTNFNNMKTADMENFVKQHWNESDTAKDWLEYYASLDPDTMESFNDKTESQGSQSPSYQWYAPIRYGTGAEAPIPYRPEQ